MQRRRMLQLAALGLVAAAGPVRAAGRPVGPQGLYAPARGDVRLVVISDLNSAYGSTTYQSQVLKAVKLIPGWQPDLVLCGGDHVAGQWRSLKPAQMQAMWSAFDRLIFTPLREANLPYGFTLGNHDAACERTRRGSYIYEEEREQAAAFWKSRDPGLPFVDRADFPFNYTFAANGIFFLVWDASCAQLSVEQLAWAEKSLAGSAARKAKLRMAIGHLPLYAVAVKRDLPGEYIDNAEQVRALLERYGVHTYISGHSHAYYPAYRGKLQLLHAGALGAGPRSLLGGALRPWHPLTVVDIDLAAASTVYTTYDVATLKVFDQTRLPRLLVGPEAAVLRRDVRWEDLSAAEQQSCLARHGEKGCR